MKFFTLSLLALLLVTGCDSTEEPVFGAEFVVGTWVFAGLTDTNGSGDIDRTQTALQSLTSYSITFGADGQAQIVADLSDTANAGGSSDLDVTVDYTANASGVSFPGVSFDAVATGEDTMTLTGDGDDVAGLLNLDLLLSLNPSATVRLVRI